MSLNALTRRRASALLFGGAASTALPPAARAQTALKLHIAAIPLESASEAFYARDTGIFAKAGIDAEISTMVNGAAIAAAVVSKSIDIGYITLDALASIHEKGIPLVVVAPCSEYLSGAQTGALLVAANSPIRTGKDLDGKTVAVVALNGVTHLATRAWVDQTGGDSTTVKYVEIPPSSMPAAIEAGRVDAAYEGQPFISMSKNVTRPLFYGSDAIAKRYLSSAWCASLQWAKDHPELVRRFAAAMRETAAWAAKNPAKCAELFAGYSKIDPAVLAATPRVLFVEHVTPALIQPLIDASAKYNGFQPFPATDLLYTPPR